MYTHRMGLGDLIRKSNAPDTACNLAAATGTYAGYLVNKECNISEFEFYVTLAVVAGGAAPQIVVKRRPTYNSASGELTIATLIIPNGTAAGKCVVKMFAPYQLFVGDELSFQTTVQANDTGTAAGAGFVGAVLEVDDESNKVQNNLVVSA